MKKSKLAIFVLVFLSAAARAEEKPAAGAWQLAFPEESASAEGIGFQSLVIANELGYGAFFMPVGGKAVHDNAVEEIKEQLHEKRMRKVALESVRKAHPEHAAMIDKKLRYDLLQDMEWIGPVTPELRQESHDLYSTFLASPDSKTVNALVEEEAAKLSKMPGFSVNALKASAEAERDAAKALKRVKLGLARDLGIGALLIADGGARLAATLTGRNAGVMPAIAIGRGLIKSEPKAAAKVPAADTTMSVE